MYEQAGILSVNCHNDVRWIQVAEADMNSATQALFSLLRENKMPWPQLLDTQAAGSGQWEFLITGPQETLGAIETAVGRAAGMSLGKRELSSVTATCQGAFASSLPEEIANALAQAGVPAHKMLFGSMSLTVIVDATDRERATQTIHDLKPRSI